MRKIGLALLVALCWIPCEAKHMAVVVDRTNTTPSLSAVEVSKIFQAAMRKWPDGRNITIVLRDPSSAETQELLQRLCKLKESDVKGFLVGHRTSFLVVDSDEAVLKTVESTPGAVGLVDVYSITSRVNVVKIDGKLPLEQGYLLH